MSLTSQAVLSKTFNVSIISILTTSKYPRVNFLSERAIYYKYYNGNINLNSPYFVEQRRPLN